MMNFFKDYDKVTKEENQQTAESGATRGQSQNASFSVDDMKAYFDSMKESLMNDIKSEMSNMLKSQTELPTQSTELSTDSSDQSIKEE